jgi:hypothetical protein
MLDHDLPDPISGNESPVPLGQIQNALSAFRKVLHRRSMDCQQSGRVRLAVLKSGSHKPVSDTLGFFQTPPRCFNSFR